MLSRKNSIDLEITYNKDKNHDDKSAKEPKRTSGFNANKKSISKKQSTEKKTTVNKQPKQRNLLKPGEMFLLFTSRQFTIFDEVELRPENKLGITRYMRRRLQLHAVSDISRTGIIIPNRISYPINTSQWEIDYKDLRSPYLRYMIATAYSMEAISLEEAIPGNILIIGLGGGAMNNYLRHQTKNINTTVVEIDPLYLDIATKYFGFIEDDRQRCIIKDGAVYIKESVERGEKFHVVVIDASYSDITYTLCPCEIFFNESVAAYLPKIIETTGELFRFLSKLNE
ncbi:unnamed protein product [Dracunculus medinensis]|uniref:PABS domain-containing protein n=1 Tax=Dracunculus medinensis TaxID=318479 RepID=A0A0N4UNR9_DRAME|nr:unnamed protein product [Dracunculus medinensis]